MSSAYAKYEDGVLRKVLRVTLDPSQADAAASPPTVYLQGLAEVSGAAVGKAAALVLITAGTAGLPRLQPNNCAPEHCIAATCGAMAVQAHYAKPCG